VIPVEKIAIDERTRIKCQFGCPNYRRGLMCPPYVPAPEVFSKVLNRYNWAILFEFEVPGEDVKRVDEVQKQVQALIERMELEAMSLGYNFALGLKAGGCRICDRCVAWLGEENLLCRHPDRARPAMEALGIDVIQTLRNTGYDTIPRRVFSLLLVD
ncbi:hypothetical protein DRN98_07050, partial [Methanosarcinales archaeon]